MAKVVQKEKAITLRKKGKSLSEIAQELKVSKGSVSIWVRDVVLSDSAKRAIELKLAKGSYEGRLKGSLANKKKKIDAEFQARQMASREIGKVSDRDLLMIGTALFWAEGNKKGSRFVFSNSDPAMISLMASFLQKCMDVTHGELYLSIQINESHKSRSDKVIKFWTKHLGFDKSQIRGPYFIRTKTVKQYANSDNYFGIARLQVRRSSVLQYEILGYIRGLAERFNMSG